MCPLIYFSSGGPDSSRAAVTTVYGGFPSGMSCQRLKDTHGSHRFICVWSAQAQIWKPERDISPATHNVLCNESKGKHGATTEDTRVCMGLDWRLSEGHDHGNVGSVMSNERRSEYQSAQQRPEKTARRPNEWLSSIKHPFPLKARNRLKGPCVCRFSQKMRLRRELRMETNGSSEGAEKEWKG